jgi:hypothetical protein
LTTRGGVMDLWYARIPSGSHLTEMLALICSAYVTWKTNWKEALVIVKPETLIGWHRKSFQLFWKGKSQAGRPRIPESIRNLIVQMAQENPTWGQARVSAELSVKLGIYVSPRTRLLASRAGATGPPEDLFAELEDVCPQSCPVNRRL